MSRYTNEELRKHAEWLLSQGDGWNGDKTSELYRIVIELLTQKPSVWEVKGIYCNSYDEAKRLYPDREPEPMFYQLNVLE